MLCTWEMGLKFTRFDPVFVWGRKTRFRQDYWWVISLKNFVWQNKDIRKLFASVQSFPKTVATRKQTKHLNWTIHSSCCHSQSGELMGFPFLCATDTLDPKFFFESQHTVCFVRNGFELDLYGLRIGGGTGGVTGLSKCLDQRNILIVRTKLWYGNRMLEDLWPCTFNLFGTSSGLLKLSLHNKWESSVSLQSCSQSFFIQMFFKTRHKCIRKVLWAQDLSLDIP